MQKVNFISQHWNVLLTTWCVEHNMKNPAIDATNKTMRHIHISHTCIHTQIYIHTYILGIQIYSWLGLVGILLKHTFSFTTGMSDYNNHTSFRIKLMPLLFLLLNPLSLLSSSLPSSSISPFFVSFLPLKPPELSAFVNSCQSQHGKIQFPFSLGK